MNRTRPSLIHSGWIRTVAMALLVCVGVASCNSRAARRAGFQLLGTPARKAVPESAKAIADLQRWRDRLYVAYGDVKAGAGPIPVVYYDLGARRFVHDDRFTADEEAIELYRVIGGTLYIPGADARERGSSGLGERLRRVIPWLAKQKESETSGRNREWEWGNLYYRSPVEGRWTKLRTIPHARRVLDVAAYRGHLYVATGSADYDPESCNGGYCPYAAVYRSADRGATWELAYKETGILQFWELHAYGGKLYVTAGALCRVCDGESWSPANCLPAGSGVVRKHVMFQHLLALVPDRSWDGPLYLFDGVETKAIPLDHGVRDVVVIAGQLFVLTGAGDGRGAIYTTADVRCRCPRSFSQAMAFDFGSQPTALEYANGRFYIGLRDGRLYESAPYGMSSRAP